jgi:HlyD family secretion protein
MLPPENVKVRFFVREAVLGALSSGRKIKIRCDGCAAAIPATISYEPAAPSGRVWTPRPT